MLSNTNRNSGRPQHGLDMGCQVCGHKCTEYGAGPMNCPACPRRERERLAWLQFYAGVAGSMVCIKYDLTEDLANVADYMIEEYRKRWEQD